MTKHDQRMWDLRYKPRAYEYKVEPAPLPEMIEHEESEGVGVLLLALLASIIDLPVLSESAIEDGGK
jgi:hypothetical protein